ncbi:Tat pathway signal protein [Actinomadura geliboluensis]|uniref:Tat pathway signal protein n=1 Tax=Actinomadura geliboluensis TaxID=882440 RepID=A0A5S4H3G2_9ACTN|nr:Tat pathway signal protein [Actinomadura geliboluensis]TMR33360.1 Tat pathway signal protein [Actinomadura geliboluensis]
MTRTRNERLAALLTEAGWSRAQAASAYNNIVRQTKDRSCTIIGRSHISMWVGGTRPTGRAPIILCQALSRQLKREITPNDLGFEVPNAPPSGHAQWSVDPLVTLTDLGRMDLDPERRSLLTGAVYSAAALAIPNEATWRALAASTNAQDPRTTQRVGRGDVMAVRQLTVAFSQLDQRRGGGHGRTAVVQYLNSDVAAFLRGTFPDATVRRDMYSAAAELAYLAGWMAFDNAEHALAQRYFQLALTLAGYAENEPLSGHILRAMAHQAIDLGYYKLSLELSTESMKGQRYLSATPRERALLGVVHARGLAVNNGGGKTAKALLKAEDDLRAAGDGIEEPHRTFFFGEASLAHETGCALRDSGDHQGAIHELQRSVRTRGSAFKRTHVVTLGYLAAAQCGSGRVEEACKTWAQALDALEDGIYSGRARQTVLTMREQLSPFRHRGIPIVAKLDARGASYLAQVD